MSFALFGQMVTRRSVVGRTGLVRSQRRGRQTAHGRRRTNGQVVAFRPSGAIRMQPLLGHKTLVIPILRFPMQYITKMLTAFRINSTKK